MTAVTVLGIRHHGPGSARSVGAALDDLQPDVVVIEGPPELDGLIDLARSSDLVPPVAALAYVPDEPGRASFYPLAAFSPEWVALRWAIGHGATVRFADLPAANALAPAPSTPDGEPEQGELLLLPEPAEADRSYRKDPISRLASLAGQEDAEVWWEDQVEHRDGGLDVFAAVGEAMAALRAADDAAGVIDEETLRREAAMRQVLRAVIKDGAEHVAVVCGAWHAPVLHPDTFPTLASDRARLKGLAKVKVAVTWIPWTNARLAFRSGYGAGVTSPGWYQHRFAEQDRPLERWLVAVTRALRGQRLEVSSASTIEAVRLAETLAALRGRPAPGLAETDDAARAVLTFGSGVPLALVRDELIVGDDRGRVPDATPTVPIARDLTRTIKRLRLKVSAMETIVSLDLRTPSHLERSTLFHRLLLLSVPWALPGDAGRSLGTFKEAWTTTWQPETDLAVIEAARLGNTVASAATVAAIDATEKADLPALASLVEATLYAELPEARRHAVAALDARAAAGADLTVLMGAVEPLARVCRYGDVRNTDTAAVADVLDALVVRIAVGLPGAGTDVADDLAAALLAGLDAVQRGVALLGHPDSTRVWNEGLAGLAAHDRIHGVLAGRATRILLDGGLRSPADVEATIGVVLHPAADITRGAHWLEGFLAGDDTVLLHDLTLLRIVDTWLQRIPAETFDAVLPLLRRSFGGFAPTSRRQIGAAVAALDRAGPTVADADLHADRADLVVPIVRVLLGTGA